MAFFKKQPDLNETLFTLRFTTKQMEKSAKKAEKEQKTQEAKIKKALEQGNKEGARIYAENAIRKKNESLNYLRMAARIDAVSSRVQTAMMMKDLSKQMGSVVKGLDGVMATMDLEKISGTMDKFERLFADIDTHTEVMESTMASATTLTTPEDQVESLMREVAEENGLEVLNKIDENPVSNREPTAGTLTTEEEEKLTRRLAKLRDPA